LTKKGIKACALNYMGNSTKGLSVDAVYYSDSSEEETESEGVLITDIPMEEIENGKYQLVYAHPEAIISSRTGRKLLNNTKFKKNLCCIAIDEGHMILEWYVIIHCYLYTYYVFIGNMLAKKNFKNW
jgi:superfamily II DNA helicase RecQ